MPVIPSYNPTANPIPGGFAFCQVKKSWSDQWLFIPWIFPVQATECVAPEIGEADVRFDFGNIKRETAAAFQFFGPQQIRDWYLRILVQYPYQLIQPVWTGVLTDDQLIPQRPSVLSGTQNVKAFGLMHLFDRQIISKARFEDDEGTVDWIDWVPTFNERNRSGMQLDGNRSEDENEGSYVFSSKGEVWTNLDIVKYLLKNFAPEAFDVQLAGQSEVLDDIEDVHDLRDKSVWEALCHLIDRRRGIGFYPYVDQGGAVYLYVFTVTDKTISAGGKKLPANGNQQYYTLPSMFPYWHEVPPIAFQVTSTAKYDKCYVRGERAKVTGTFSFRDDTLEIAWSEDLEDKYEEGADDNDDEEANDKARSTEQLRDVFRAFRVPADWDGQCGDGDGGDKSNVLLKPSSDGKMSTKKKGAFWRHDKEFLRELPFEYGKDYSEAPPTDNQQEDSENQFQPILVAIKDVRPDDPDLQKIQNHETDDKWHLIDKLNEENEDLHSSHVMPMHRQLGIKLSCSPGHYFAIVDFDNENPPSVEAEMDFNYLLVTATFELDVRQYVKAFEGASSTDTERTLTIDVPGAEYWYAAPDTVIDVRNGDLVRIAEDNCKVRDDVDKLKAVAAFARAWYEPFRQTVQITVKRMGLLGTLGGLLKSINDFSTNVTVNTVMTSRTINFDDQMTRLETGWLAFDVGAVVTDLAKNRRRRKSRL